MNITSPVSRTVSSRLGQLTFCSSNRVSLTNKIGLIIVGVYFNMSKAKLGEGVGCGEFFVVSTVRLLALPRNRLLVFSCLG